MRRGKSKIGLKSWIGLGFLTTVLIVGLFSLPKIFDTVEKGTYQVKQAAITGEMTAKMTPGTWLQLWGDIDPWPKAETFFFTHDNDTKGDVDIDTSMEVRFNDGSLCKISGTLRIIMPITESEAIALTTEKGHKTYLDVQEKLIKPTVRNVLRSTANLMSARESYSEKRPDFVSWSRDQIENGIYQTEETTKQVKDLVSGEMIWKRVKKIKQKDGIPLHQKNPMAGSGIVLTNFEIKQFVYEKKVQKQISSQQEARMAVETAKAKAEEAEQDRLTIEAEGKAKVATARYEEEQIKMRAVVVAQRDKEVKIIEGERLKEYAGLERDAAKLQKEKNILDGQGLAEKRRLVLAADGALKQKLATYEMVNKDWADAFARRKVPAYYMSGQTGDGSGGNGSLDMETKQFQQMINILTAQSLGLDLSIKTSDVETE
jgi:regulator of protease activity HflC (stomatin/prohibitin superfamily)